ncbi:hypothetical protein K9O30_06545 [Clostridium bowmanii]|uniref:hypothetical protein n=1 Tax=Clostridium bowmanii TaxID=132925 RepID=UPI001C0C0239|nr:hypothetical protein [Clostridium bowmanii]MBU3188819.1 hypothetical protein [Clostridium bowmanii]MCA1073402.1 hypothetical protein [Clostridium bowmanii]
MGKLEEEEADKFTKYAAIKGLGYADEIGFSLASIVDSHNKNYFCTILLFL